MFKISPPFRDNIARNKHFLAPEWGTSTDATLNTAIDIYAFGMCALETAALELIPANPPGGSSVTSNGSSGGNAANGASNSATSGATGSGANSNGAATNGATQNGTTTNGNPDNEGIDICI